MALCLKCCEHLIVVVVQLCGSLNTKRLERQWAVKCCAEIQSNLSG